MKAHKNLLTVSAMALAVAAALTAPLAIADDEEAAELKTPSSYVEFGLIDASGGASFKGGEYSGINTGGTYVNGNFLFQGGSAYKQDGGTLRWKLQGQDLGLSSRSLTGSIADQGRWSFSINYDELTHSITDSYLTPYRGVMGGNSFTLAPGFGVAANTTTMTAAQQGALQRMDISTNRTNTSLTGKWELTDALNISFDYNHLDQNGAKLMGFGAMANGGATGEMVAILPMPTNYKTDTVNVGLNWQGESAHLSGSYHGSFFRNGFDRVTFQTYAGANNMQTMSTAPGNDLHQLNLSGGYTFTPKRKIVGNLSYSRNTQNDPFVYDAFMMVTPSQTASLNGKVVNTHADVKLTDQSIKDLTLSGAFKYDERDNRTSSFIYNFFALDGTAGNSANYPNTPLSTRKMQADIAGDYRIKRDHYMRLSYGREQTERWCNQYAVNATYIAGTNCVVATDSAEDKLGASYRLKAIEDVDLKFDYGYNVRKTNSDTLARAAFISVRGGGAGLNGGDFLGFYPYFNASRAQQLAKVTANWQATDKLTLGVSGKYTDDRYDSYYGVTKGNSWSFNLDSTYSYSENGSVFGYATRQHRARDLLDQQATATATGTRVLVPVGSTWTNQLKDDDVTLGLGFKQTQLMGGRLDITGDATHSVATSSYTTALNYLTYTTAPFVTCLDPSILSCGALPDIKSTMTQVKLTGSYKLDKTSKISFGFIHRRLNADDFFYNGYQLGMGPTQVMPTNQQPGSYSYNLIATSYVYTFK